MAPPPSPILSATEPLSDDATVTFDVTPVNDPTIVTGAASDVTFNDSDTVNIPMSGFFDDVDGDALTYGGVNLPAGLIVDPATGVLGGVLDNSGLFRITIHHNHHGD